MANNIKQIKIGNTTYDLVDAGARDLINSLNLNGIKFILSSVAANTPEGVRTLGTNGSVITGELTAIGSYKGTTIAGGGAGSIYLVKSIPESDNPYDERDVYDEYVVLYKGSNSNPSADTVASNFVWERLGNTEIDFSELGALAYKNAAEGNYTPEGSISVTVNTSDATKDVTPAGTISQPTFTGDSKTITSSFTPAGTINKPAINVTPTTDEIQPVSSVGSLPTWSASVTDEVLSFTFGAGTLPTLGTKKTFVTGATAALAAAPTFTGTPGEATATYKPTGTVSQPSFSGTTKTITVKVPSTTSGTFTGTPKKVTVS